jgi:protein TonB
MTNLSLPAGPRLHGALWATRDRPTPALSMPRALALAVVATVALAGMLAALRPRDEAQPPQVIMRATLVPPPVKAPVTAVIARAPVVQPPVAHRPPARPAAPKPVPPVVPPPHIAAAAAPEPTAPAIATAPAEAKAAPPVAPAAPAPAPVTPTTAPLPMAKPAGIAVICPVQVRPQMPQRAIDDGLSGVVHARARIEGGRVQEVVIVDGPQVFHAAVKAAMMRYQCQQSAEGAVWAEQRFVFKLDED